MKQLRPLPTRLRDDKRSAAATPQLRVFVAEGGLRSGIDPTSNKSMLTALEDDA
jgi:hypothetical protein